MTEDARILIKSPNNDYIVKIADNQSELDQAFSLRYDVFNQELNSGLPQSSATRKDQDNYDALCEHLIVKHSSEDRVIGTYRILNRNVAKQNFGFYSEQEFNLDQIYTIPEGVAEVGRSCVHQNYRGGTAISLLWSGLAKYMKINSTRYLIGSGSIHSTDQTVAEQIYAWLRDKNALSSNELTIKPISSKSFSNFDLKANPPNTLAHVPPLIKGYLRLGAKYGGIPALDAEFGTTDFFVFFDYNQVNLKYGNHYK